MEKLLCHLHEDMHKQLVLLVTGDTKVRYCLEPARIDRKL